MIKPTLFALLSSGALLVSAALSQDAIYQGLTARELCLRPPVAQAVSKTTTKPPQVARTRPAPPPPQKGITPTPAPVPDESPAPDMRLVSNQPESTVPLGMRYSLLQRMDGKYQEVSPDAVFHAGDRIQLHVETFDSGYLYIVQQGSSKRWEVLFPNSETNAGDNHVARGQVTKLQFYFDQQAGSERLFVVFTRQPQRELEDLIYTLANNPKAIPDPGPRPKVLDPAPVRQSQKTMVAQNRVTVDDQLVAGLRSSLVSRDLVFEKVDEDSGDKKEKAVYVAVPSRSPDARLIADLSLRHQ